MWGCLFSGRWRCLATGAILTLTCAYAMRRNNEKYGLVTMCIGGGQGISLVIESL